MIFIERLETALGRTLSIEDRILLKKAMPTLKVRAKTLIELADKARFYVERRPIPIAEDAAEVLTTAAREHLQVLHATLLSLGEKEWTAAVLEAELRRFADRSGVKLGSIAQPLRAALTGSLASPGLFDVMEILGRVESLGRIDDAAGRADG